MINESTLSSVMGDPTGGPNSGIFIGPLSGISSNVMRKRLLYPTYKNSSGTNKLVKTPLSEECLYNENEQPLTGADIQTLMELGIKNKLGYNGGKLVQIEPKCAAFPYCNQGAIDKPIKLIGSTKAGMCENCYDYCKHLAEQTGKSPEWIAEGFRQHTFKKLDEITKNDQQQTEKLLQNLQAQGVEPTKLQKIKDTISRLIIDPWITYEEIVDSVQHILSKISNLNETIEAVDNKQKQNIQEMLSLKVKNMSLQQRKKIMEAVLGSKISECATTKLQSEGFLPLNEELNGLTMEESFKALMEDDEVANEMFEAIMEDDCDCSVNEWLQENNFIDGDESDAADASMAMLSTEPTDEPGEEGGDELQTLVDTLVSLQTKHAGSEEDSEILTTINGMLNQAKSLKSQVTPTLDVAVAVDADGIEPPAEVVGSTEDETEGEAIDAPPVSAGDHDEEPGDAPEMDGETSTEDEPIEEAIVPGVPKASTRKTLDQDFLDKVVIFRDTMIEDLRWQSLKSYYQFAPEVTPEDLMSYLTPQPEENGLGFFGRVTDIKNDPTGFNRMLMNMMNPTKRGYFQKFAAKYDRGFIDSVDELMSDMWSKYQAIQTMLAGENSPLAGGEDEEGDGPLTPADTYGKDDFEDDFKDLTAEPDDAAIAATAATRKPIAAPVSDMGDEDDEDPLMENEMKPVMGKNVMSDNKANAQETVEQAKDAEDSQKTEDLKVEELKNQKFEKTQAQIDTEAKNKGRNNLDLDYTTEPSEAFKTRVKKEASGKVPEDHANVDHDSTAGEDLIDAAKDRASVNQKQYTSTPDATVIKPEEGYKITTAVNEEIERMKKMMTFDVTILKENKVNKKINEDRFLIGKVQTKKFI